MTFYKLHLSFRGTRFLGWQKQKDFRPTVQDDLEKALRVIFKSDLIHTIGSGRTDTGVHSLGHVVKLSAPFEIAPKNLVRALNSNLPVDIRVHEASFCSENFRPTNDALKKEYKYLFTTNAQLGPFQFDTIANYPYELDFEKMRCASKLFIGRHDFRAFSCVGSEPNSTIREIYECELITNIEPNMQGIFPEYHMIRVVGNGFLKQMVRLVVGSLWHIGRGKLGPDAIVDALSGIEFQRIGEVAPPQGLYKVKTWY